MRFDAAAMTYPAMPGREIVHDLRNLFGVLAAAGHLLETRPDGPGRAQLLNAIAGAALRGGELTTALLGSAPAAAGHPLDISARLAGLEPMLRAIAGGAGLRIERGEDPLFAGVAPLDLDAAVLELVANAHAALRDRGTITVRLRRAGERIWLIVADDGNGMAPARLAEVLRGPARPAANGTGLRRVRTFAAAGQGGFHIRSRPGRGTVVAISLPLAAHSAHPARPAFLPPSGE